MKIPARIQCAWGFSYRHENPDAHPSGCTAAPRSDVLSTRRGPVVKYTTVLSYLGMGSIKKKRPPEFPNATTGNLQLQNSEKPLSGLSISTNFCDV